MTLGLFVGIGFVGLLMVLKPYIERRTYECSRVEISEQQKEAMQELADLIVYDASKYPADNKPFEHFTRVAVMLKKYEAIAPLKNTMKAIYPNIAEWIDDLAEIARLIDKYEKEEETCPKE